MAFPESKFSFARFPDSFHVRMQSYLTPEDIRVLPVVATLFRMIMVPSAVWRERAQHLKLEGRENPKQMVLFHYAQENKKILDFIEKVAMESGNIPLVPTSLHPLVQHRMIGEYLKDNRYNGMDLLFAAVQEQNEVIINLLLTFRVAVTSPCLFLAIVKKNSTVVQLLLKDNEALVEQDHVDYAQERGEAAIALFLRDIIKNQEYIGL